VVAAFGPKILAGEGRGGMITMPGDIPATRAGEIDAVLSAHLAAPSFTISPAHDDLGSNAVACSPPESVPLRFGDNSYLFTGRGRRRSVQGFAVRRCPLQPSG
jgi:2-phospho-L-lactate/phosphoenolpyruvate guanylyltransferase